MKYTVTYATAYTMTHDLPDLTHTCDTLTEALAWADSLVEFLKGVDDVMVYEVNPA